MIEHIKKTLGIRGQMSIKSIDDVRFIVYLEDEYFGIYDTLRNTFVD